MVVRSTGAKGDMGTNALAARQSKDDDATPTKPFSRNRRTRRTSRRTTQLMSIASGTDSSTAFNHDNSLTTIARLDDDISALPPSETVAYRRAH